MAFFLCYSDSFERMDLNGPRFKILDPKRPGPLMREEICLFLCAMSKFDLQLNNCKLLEVVKFTPKFLECKLYVKIMDLNTALATAC